MENAKDFQAGLKQACAQLSKTSCGTRKRYNKELGHNAKLQQELKLFVPLVRALTGYLQQDNAGGREKWLESYGKRYALLKQAVEVQVKKELEHSRNSTDRLLSFMFDAIPEFKRDKDTGEVTWAYPLLLNLYDEALKSHLSQRKAEADMASQRDFAMAQFMDSLTEEQRALLKRASAGPLIYIRTSHL
jgi:hypothetical protein